MLKSKSEIVIPAENSIVIFRDLDGAVYYKTSDGKSHLTDSYHDVFRIEDPKFTSYNNLTGEALKVLNLTKQEFIFSLTDISVIGGGGTGRRGPRGAQGATGATGGGSGSCLTDVTYAQLMTLINSNSLSPGCSYRITDFSTREIIPNTAVVVTGATEQLIVQADTTSTLNERAISDLFPFDEIYYDVNDTANGASKGRIYFRLDTTRNISTWYDWRVYKFRRWEVNSGAGDYTSTTDTGFAFLDFYTFENDINVSTNTFVPAANGNAGNTFNFTIGGIQTDGSLNNVFGLSCHTNFIGMHSFDNTVSNFFTKNTIDRDFRSNIITINFEKNKLGYQFRQNTILGTAIENVIQHSFINNTMNGNFNRNIINSNMGGNTCETDFSSNNIGIFFETNTIGNSFSANIIGNNFGSVSANTIGNAFTNNIVGNDCDSNAIDDNFQNNVIGSEFEGNQIGINFKDNFIQNTCRGNTFGDNCIRNNIYSFFQNNTTSNSFQYNHIDTNISGTDFTAGATLVYQAYTKNLFTRSDSSYQLSYVDNTNTIIYAAITA